MIDHQHAVTESELAGAFAEWERRRRANPSAFMAPAEVEAGAPEEIGQRAARELLRLLGRAA